MPVPKIALRVATLEAEVTQLKRQIEAVTLPAKPWWEHVVGAFADDPAFEEAMRLGREYRESLRPKPRAKSTKRTNHAKTAKARKR
jgi:hypothetical protein